uniref:Enolase n=1 Tax=Anthurium amnicola TaxID=1678845 RepID=A0A1D1Z9A2_9ARAE
MRETDVNMDAGGKRRLPMWMCKRSAPEELKGSGNDESRLLLQGQDQSEAPLRKLKTNAIKAGEELARQVTNNFDETSGSFFRSGTRKRSKRSSRFDVNPRITRCSEAALERKKDPAVDSQSRTQESYGYEKAKQIINVPGPQNDMDSEALFLTKSEDQVELTVDDLVSIAEEYVSIDKEKEQWQTANEKSKSEALNSSPSVLGRNNFGVLCRAAQNSPQILNCMTTAYGSHLSATDMVEHSPPNISRTGDAAKDMLDLFLGPLLRMPIEGNLKELKKK